MRDLDGLHDPAELDVLMAPVELAVLAGRERQRHEGLGESWAGFDGFPTPDEPLHAVVGTAVALSLQSLEQPACGAALGFRQMALDPQPGFQDIFECPQHRHRLLLAAVEWLALTAAMFTHSRPGQVQITGDRTDTLLADEVTTPDLGNQIHDQHPRFSNAKARGSHDQGGNYWTLFTPGIWKYLHAVLHPGTRCCGCL